MIHIILPVHNRRATTVEMAGSLAGQLNRDFRLVLVDDGCTDGTVEAVKAELVGRDVRVLTGDGNLWWAGALDLAHRSLCQDRFPDDDAVLILNDDVAFAADFLDIAQETLSRHPGCCIQAIGLDPMSDAVDFGVVADRLRLRFRAAAAGEQVNCLATRGLLMSMRTFRDSGGFRPTWLPHYLSDYEFTMRLHRRGVRLLVDPLFKLFVDPQLTGLGTYSGDWRRYWRTALSNRAKYNPVHWSAFALLSCPWWAVPYHVAKIWLRTAVHFVQAFHRSDDDGAARPEQRCKTNPP